MSNATVSVEIHALHLVRCYAMAARLSSGTDSLAVRLERVRSELAS